ncbi:hypothetical protein R5E32_004309 [Vibrio vulnificus]|nr:hypothetical protein [Vibrio vulnificus]
MKLSFIDKFSGSRYGARFPVGEVKGTKLFESLQRSSKWLLLEHTRVLEMKKDNRLDIDCGASYVFKKKACGKLVFVSMSKSNSGKTVWWTFTDEIPVKGTLNIPSIPMKIDNKSSAKNHPKIYYPVNSTDI